MKVILISGVRKRENYFIEKILKEVKNGFLLSTDNYYKTGFISNILSKFVENYFDKKLV